MDRQPAAQLRGGLASPPAGSTSPFPHTAAGPPQRRWPLIPAQHLLLESPPGPLSPAAVPNRQDAETIGSKGSCLTFAEAGRPGSRRWQVRGLTEPASWLVDAVSSLRPPVLEGWHSSLESPL